MKRILIINEDPDIAELLVLHSGDLCCSVTAYGDGKKGLLAGIQEHFDLIILELLTEGLDGIEICRRIRMKNAFIPIMILSAKSDETDKVLGLDAGADDYLTKPFGTREFMARIKAIFRRSGPTQAQITHSFLKYGELEIDKDKRKVTLRGMRIALSPREFELLVLLASHPGKSYNRKSLLNAVWGYDYDGYEHTINSHINRLRGKIETNIASPIYILTTWGVGYRFNEEL